MSFYHHTRIVRFFFFKLCFLKNFLHFTKNALLKVIKMLPITGEPVANNITSAALPINLSAFRNRQKRLKRPR